MDHVDYGKLFFHKCFHVDYRLSRILRFSRKYSHASMTTSKKTMRKWAQMRIAAGPPTTSCGIFQARFKTRIGSFVATPSKRQTSDGTLLSWHGISKISLALGQNMDCEDSHASAFRRMLSDYVDRSSKEWPFKLIVNVQAENKAYRYTPKSDIYLSFNGELCLMVEVQSKGNEDDRYRMLLQAACATRLGNALHRDDHVPLIITALYISTVGRIERYFFFQLDMNNPQVCSLIPI